MVEYFLLITALACTFTIAGTIVGLKRGVPFVRAMKLVTLSAVLLAPVFGALTGTFYSHGLDIPWWMFGIVTSLLMLLSALVVGTTRFLWLRYARNET